MRIVSVNAGRPRLVVHRGKRYSTAINKRPIERAVRVDAEGVAEDRQADGRYHGGPEMALCVFPHEHYAFFEGKLGRVLAVPSFGENLTTEGLLEAVCCVGDRYRIGEDVVVQITKPRTPCVKLARLHDEPAVVKWVQQTAYCGFYLRVVREGEIAAGDAVTLIDRDAEAVSVAEALRRKLRG